MHPVAMILPELLLAAETLNALEAHIAVLDATGTIVFANDAWRRFARTGGAAPAVQDYVGTNYLAVCREAIAGGDTTAGAALSGIEGVLDGRHEHFSLEYPCHSPTEQRWFRMLVTRTAGMPERHVVIAHEEITARRQAETEREELLRDQARLRQEAVRANAAKDEFIAILSHELRTPLQSVLGWAGILKRSFRDAAVCERAAAAIERSARLQAQLLEDTLDLSRVTYGKLKLQQSDVDLAAAVRDMVETTRPSALEKGVTLETAPMSPGAVVRGDPLRLRQVLWNLLANALKFTPPGGRIEVQMRLAPEWVDVAVKDSGVGIPPELTPHLFERFRQGGPVFGRTGLGLGLSIAKELVLLHGGAISAESGGAGQGATFTVRLPISPPATQSDGRLGTGP